MSDPHTVRSPFDVHALRAEFPIFQQTDSRGREVIYLDSGASAQKPQRVIDREAEVYSRYYANAYRGIYEFGQRVDDQLELTREAVRSLLGAADKAEVIFTSGATMSLNLVARCWGQHVLSTGDEILLTEMEHHANIVPWQMIARETGAVLRYLPLTADCRLDLDRLPEFLSDRTKIVSVTGMSNVLGTLVPVRAIADAAHAVGAVLVVDAAQSIVHEAVDVVGQGIDFLAFSGHKLYGPSGVGVLYGRRELLEAMPPFLGGGHMIERVYDDYSTWSPPPAKFEAGTLPIAQAIALGAAIEFVREHGIEPMARHEAELLRHALARLADIPGLTIYGPPAEHRGGIVTFTMAGAHAQDVAFLLNRKGICVRHGHHCTMPLHDRLGITASVRASFAAYNTLEEIDQLAEALLFVRQRLRID